MIVAIDGPAGAGKSTVARAARGAARLPLPRHGRDVPRADLARDRRAACRSTTATQLGELAAEHPVELRRASGRVWIAGTDVTAVDPQARHRPARARWSRATRRCAQVMRARQRELADDGDVVIEGRDIGTVVAPDAEVKVYLNADARRARAAAAWPSGRRSAPTRSRPTCACATRATPRGCGRPRTPI